MNDETPTTPLGAYIRKTREAAGFSLRQLAQLVGVNHGYLARIEAGERVKPGADVLQRIADVLEIDSQELLKFVGVKPSMPEPRVYFRKEFGVSDKELER
jgi:transcriptional regulator with XRE-family HTH domain